MNNYGVFDNVNRDFLESFKSVKECKNFIDGQIKGIYKIVHFVNDKDDSDVSYETVKIITKN